MSRRGRRELLDHAPDLGTPETVLAFVALVPDAFEFLEVVLDQMIERRVLGVSRPVDSLGMAFHIRSNQRKGLCANLICTRRSGRM